MHTLNEDSSRYGIYFCPGADTPLFGLGSRWLGRNALTGELLDPGLPDHIRHDQWTRATDSPRRYGFHATLKPPFRLAGSVTVEDLRAALRVFAEKHHSFHAPPLAVSTIGRFLALTLTAPSREFADLAGASVSEFDCFRAPASEEETAQRLRGAVSPRERENVLEWGYPYVFDTWLFHMSLTSSLHNGSISLFEPHLRKLFASACGQPLPVDSVCIFHEPHPGALFHLIDRVSLRPS